MNGCRVQILLFGLVLAVAGLSGCGAGSGGQQLPPIPGTEVTNIRADVDANGIYLTWDASADQWAVGYVVYWSEDGGDTYDIGTDVSSALTYTFSGADFVFGRAYVFKITAANSLGGESAGAATPAEATGIQCSLSGTDLILSWSGSGSSYIASYSDDGGANFVGETLGSSATDATLTGILYGVDYIFKVVSIKVVDEGTGDKNRSAGALTPIDVQGFGASPDDERIDLYWDASTSADLDNYKRYVRMAISPTFDAGTNIDKDVTLAAVGVPEDTVGTLVNGTSYTVKVVSVDEDNNESLGRWMTRIPTPAIDNTPPYFPVGSVIEATPGPRRVRIHDWTPATDNVGISYYEIRRGTLAGSLPMWMLDVSAPLTFTDTGADIGGLTNGTEYTYTVWAVDVKNNHSSATLTGLPLNNYSGDNPIS